MAVSHRLVAIDTEAHRIRPGLLAPPMVCLSFAYRRGGSGFETGLLGAEAGADFFEELLNDRHAFLVFHNAPFDLAILCSRRPRLIRPVFKALAEGRVHCTRIRQELLDIHSGRRQQNGSTLVFRDGAWQRADYTLAGLEKHYTGRDRSHLKVDPEGWRLRYAELEHLPVALWPEGARTYALDDATAPLEVFAGQVREAEALDYLDRRFAHGALVNELEQTQAAWGLHLMSCWGMRTDEASVLRLEELLLGEQRKNREVLVKAGFLKKKVATAQERREGKVDFYEEVKGKLKALRWSADKKRVAAYVERVYARKGLVAPRTEASSRHPNGQTATDKDTLYQSGSRLLKLFADGGGVDKILSTYVPVLKQGTAAPINVRYNVLVNSGRTSSFGERDKRTGEVSGCNIQNLPTGRRVGGVRECFVPRAGRLFVSVDYATLELRALAQVCLWLFGRSRMAEVINSGRDLHLEMAAGLLQLSYEEIDEAKGAVDAGKPPRMELVLRVLKCAEQEARGMAERELVARVKAAVKRARDCAKVANFGLPGGLGAESLVEYARTNYGVTLTVEQAIRLKKDWLAAWPEMTQYFAYINAKVGFGEAKLVQFWSNRVRGGVGYCDGCNTLFQGLAADGAKRALFRILFEMYCDESSPLYGCRLVAFIHDEFIAEVPEERAHEASYRLAQVACEEMQAVLRDVKIKAEPALMRRWFKDAAEVLDDAGRLVPWEPEERAAA